MMLDAMKEIVKMVISIIKINVQGAHNFVNNVHLQTPVPNALKDTTWMIVQANADNVKMVQLSAHFLQP